MSSVWKPFPFRVFDLILLIWTCVCAWDCQIVDLHAWVCVNERTSFEMNENYIRLSLNLISNYLNRFQMHSSQRGILLKMVNVEIRSVVRKGKSKILKSIVRFRKIFFGKIGRYKCTPFF